MIHRNRHLDSLKGLLRDFPVVGLIGARQVGKTTLAKMLAREIGKETHFFDLEDPADFARLSDPMLALRELGGLVILDELQHSPHLMNSLRVLADRTDAGTRFLILGSASPRLIKKSSESLAGRVAYHQLAGFGLSEIKSKNWKRLWLRGGFPLSFLGRSEAISLNWRDQFIGSYLDAELPGLGIQTPPATLRRFWSMLAHYHGQIWNASEFARSFGIDHKSVGRYLDILSSTFVVRQLQAFRENLAKRQVKAPKIFLSDSGMLHTLLGIRSYSELLRHPKLGASWEGFAMEMVIQELGANPWECFFWATHAGAELDLLVIRGSYRWGFEFKYSSAPTTSRSMHISMKDLGLKRLDVIHAGMDSYPLGKKMRAIPLNRIATELDPARAFSR